VVDGAFLPPSLVGGNASSLPSFESENLAPSLFFRPGGISFLLFRNQVTSSFSPLPSGLRPDNFRCQFARRGLFGGLHRVIGSLLFPFLSLSKNRLLNGCSAGD